MCLGVLNDLLEFTGFLIRKPFIKLVVESQAKVPACTFPVLLLPLSAGCSWSELWTLEQELKPRFFVSRQTKCFVPGSCYSAWRAITEVKCLVLFTTSLEEKIVEMALSKLCVSKVCGICYRCIDYKRLPGHLAKVV